MDVLDAPEAQPMAVRGASFVLPFSLMELVFTALVSVAVYLYLRPPAHERFATKHGLTNVKTPVALKSTLPVLGDLLSVFKHMDRLPDSILDVTRIYNEQPWLRRLPFLPDAIMISSPALVEDVVKTQNDNFGKSKLMHEVVYDVVGDAFFSLDGPAWFHQRKIASKFFSPRVLRDVGTAMINKHSLKLFALLDKARESQQRVDLTRIIHEFTFQTFAELGFGLQVETLGNPEGHPLERAIDDAFPRILSRMQMPTWLWKLQRFLNIGGERRFRERIVLIRSLVSQLVSESLAASEHKKPEDAATLVDLFIHAMRDGDIEFSPDLLCSLAVMFMIGGRDTSADTMCWILYVLGKHPDVEAKIRAELMEKVPGLMTGELTTLTMEQVSTLTYVEAVIKETMRLYPVVPLTVRQADEETVLSDGTYIPKGALVGLLPYVMGRLESIWGEDVLEFKPERFIDPDTGKLRVISAFQFFSFLAGPRICIGMNLAMLEMKLVLAGLLSRFHFDLAPNDGSYRVSATMPLKHPLLARVLSVSAAAN